MKNVEIREIAFNFFANKTGHPELVSGTHHAVSSTGRLCKWVLKQVQHDLTF